MVVDTKGDIPVSEVEASGCGVLTGICVVLIELGFLVLFWVLCSVETVLGSERFLTVTVSVVKSFITTSLVAAPSPLAVVIIEVTVGSGGVCMDSLLVVPLGDVPTVDVITSGDDDFVTCIETDAPVVEGAPELNAGVV